MRTNKYADADLQRRSDLAISLKYGAKAPALPTLSGSYAANIPFPVGLAHDADMKGYGRIWRLPLTFVVDRKGILRMDQWYGDPGLDAQLLEQTVTPLLRTP